MNISFSQKLTQNVFTKGPMVPTVFITVEDLPPEINAEERTALNFVVEDLKKQLSTVLDSIHSQNKAKFG